VPNAFRLHLKFKPIRVGESTGGHDPRLRIRLVDVTGIEPVTPCLQSRRGKTLKALSGVVYTENWRNSCSLKCPEVVANFSRPLNFRMRFHVGPQSAIFPRLYRRGAQTSVLHMTLNSLSDFDGLQSVIYHGIYRKEVI